MKNGFTLIELTLYISISFIILLSLSSFFSLILQSRIKSQAIAEIEQGGVHLIQTITQIIRNAEGINSPSLGNSSATLSLDAFGIINDPTSFDLSSGLIRITEGTNSPIELNSSKVIVSDLIFKNLSYDQTPGIIRIEFILTHLNPENRNEFNYSKKFYASASLK